MKTITLGKKVIISDPCYSPKEKGCNVTYNTFKPGEYVVDVIKSDEGSWGIRCAKLIVIHTLNLGDNLKWVINNKIIGVDSGQAGVFDERTFGNDNLKLKEKYYTMEGRMFKLPYRKPGDAFYEKMCQITLSNNRWGVCDGGVVTSTGFGDGAYELWTARKNKQIVGVIIDFIPQEQYVLDYWFEQNLGNKVLS
jgi:hypothetical protein